MDFAEAIQRAAGLFCGFTGQKASDGEITDTELNQMDGELDEIKAAIACERAKREAAYGVAMGHPADLNKATKIGYPKHLDRCNCAECRLAAETIDKV